MISKKWFRYFFIIGSVFLAIGFIYYSYLFFKGIPLSISEVFFNLFPSLLLILFGTFGPNIFDSSEQFPDGIFCPHCANITDKNPCTHCGENVFQSLDIEKHKNDNKKNGAGDMEKSSKNRIYYWLLLILVAIISLAYILFLSGR